jgi:hypothetical protein
MSEGKFSGADERLKKSAGAQSREDRATADADRKLKDGTSLTIEERRRMMRSEWNQEVLPTPPATPGWHYCWLSTTSSADPIYKRVQKGYEPVKVSEIPGFAQYSVTQGEFEGCIACNEMVLFKLPEELYQDYMSYLHHELPNDEETMLKANAAVQGQDSDGRELGQTEGFDSLARKTRQPHFAS